jgi:hypothetical protein
MDRIKTALKNYKNSSQIIQNSTPKNTKKKSPNLTKLTLRLFWGALLRILGTKTMGPFLYYFF